METTVVLRQKKLGAMKGNGHAYKFCLDNYFLWRTFWIWRWWDFQTTEVNAKFAPVNVGSWIFLCWQIFNGWTFFSDTTLCEKL